MKDTAATVFESVPDLGGGPEEENDSNEDGENEDGTWKARWPEKNRYTKMGRAFV